MKIIPPPYLEKGNTIGITCPAGFMPEEKAGVCIRTLGEWGYQVKQGCMLGGDSTNYFSGTDEERCKELQEMLDDKNLQAILFGRGGYGLSRIIDALDFKKFRKNPKWLIGFSDITVLHCHVLSNYGISTMHAPMAAAFNDGEHTSEYILSLKEAIAGVKARHAFASHEFNRLGSVSGRLVGGNLALLAHIVGTPSDINTKNSILFIEDIGEYLYNVDRMLYQLKRSGKFEKLRGLIIGGFTDMKDTQRPFGLKVEEIIRDMVSDYDFPVCYNFPVSHGRENVALKIGMAYNLIIKEGACSLEEK